MKKNIGKLIEIIENKQLEVAKLKTQNKPTDKPLPKRASFIKALQNNKLSLIAEVKRRSPSDNALNINMDPVEIAQTYANNGASAISVLCDKKYFGGDMDFLREIALKIDTPLLCKEFIIDPMQITLARDNGASAILLITDILEDKELDLLYHTALDLGLDVLTEAYSPENIKRAVELGANIIGINNRNLFTFEININHSVKYIGLIPEDRIRLSLSAVQNRDDAIILAKAGFDGILVGSSLMKSDDVAKAVRDLIVG